MTSVGDRYFEHLRSDISDAERIHLATHLSFLASQWTLPQKLELFKFLQPPATAGKNVAGFLHNVALEVGKTLSAEDGRILLLEGKLNPSAAMAVVSRMPAVLTTEQIETLMALDQSLQVDDDDGTKTAEHSDPRCVGTRRTRHVHGLVSVTCTTMCRSVA